MAVNLALARQKLTVLQQQNVYLLYPFYKCLVPWKKIPAEMGEWILKLNSRHKQTLTFVCLFLHVDHFTKNVLMDYQIEICSYIYVYVPQKNHNNQRLTCSWIHSIKHKLYSCQFYHSLYLVGYSKLKTQTNNSSLELQLL